MYTVKGAGHVPPGASLEERHKDSLVDSSDSSVAQ